MSSVTVDPRTRFLRVVRALSLVSGVMTPVMLGALGVSLTGCGSSSTDDTHTYAGGTGVSDAAFDTSDTADTTSDVFGSGGTSPGPDTGHDVFDGIDAGISIGDTADAAGDATDADAEIGIGGPSIAPEMLEELAA